MASATIRYLGNNRFELTWWPKGMGIVRSPSARQRITDLTGAIRFAKRHGITAPTAEGTKDA